MIAVSTLALGVLWTGGRDLVLAEGHHGDDAVTLWAVIFNNPGSCTPEEEGGPPVCGEDDLFNDEVGTAVIYVTGQRVQSNGRASFAGTVATGQTLGALPSPPFPSNMLMDPWGAEVHGIVRTHGTVIPDVLDDMITSVGGGCGQNTCEDVQFVVHLPDGAQSTTTVHRFSDESMVPNASSRLTRSAEGIILTVNTRLDDK